ncbi:MAG TPA: acetolactate synthase large subunit, partial [Leptospiraceae bacterium]|nr:acetolactate synthase large subunit [Leptospiraceae bacterium]
GMVRQWQELFYEERFAESEWQYNPDFVKLAEAYHIPAMQISHPSEVEKGLDFLLHDDGPALLEAVIPADEKVFPMIAAGKSQRDMVQFSDIMKQRSPKK